MTNACDEYCDEAWLIDLYCTLFLLILCTHSPGHYVLYGSRSVVLFRGKIACFFMITEISLYNRPYAHIRQDTTCCMAPAQLFCSEVRLLVFL